MKFEMNCWSCDEDFDCDSEDVWTTNDIVDGQYVEFEVFQCPHCGEMVRS